MFAEYLAKKSDTWSESPQHVFIETTKNLNL